MTNPFSPFVQGITLSGHIAGDATAVLQHHQLPHVARHVGQVAKEAARLAQQVGADATAAATAGWLHDISGVIPNDQRVAVAQQLGLTVLPEEATFPMILHQRLSAAMAQAVWGITDTAVLSAIACHTTLKANATRLDQIVFVADKIKWDQPGTPPYLPPLLAALNHSITHAAFVYIDYLWQQRHTLRVVHPWLTAAYQQLAPLFTNATPLA